MRNLTCVYAAKRASGRLKRGSDPLHSGLSGVEPRMQPFRILYFRHSVLNRSEVGKGDLLEVIEQAAEHRSDESAEIWSEELGKVVIVEPLPRQHRTTDPPATEEPAAEIMKEMKPRLALVHGSTPTGRRR